MRRLLNTLGFTTAVLLAGCATVENPVTGKSEHTVMDEKSEMAEGAKAHPQILAEFELLIEGLLSDNPVNP